MERSLKVAFNRKKHEMTKQTHFSRGLFLEDRKLCKLSVFSAVEGLKSAFSGGNPIIPEVGLEPTLPEGNGILNPARLPIPPLRQVLMP